MLQDVFPLRTFGLPPSSLLAVTMSGGPCLHLLHCIFIAPFARSSSSEAAYRINREHHPGLWLYFSNTNITTPGSSIQPRLMWNSDSNVLVDAEIGGEMS